MTPLALIAFLPPLFSAALIPYVLKRRATLGAKPLLVSLLALTEWGLAYAVTVLPGVNLSTKSFLSASAKTCFPPFIYTSSSSFALERASSKEHTAFAFSLVGL